MTTLIHRHRQKLVAINCVKYFLVTARTHHVLQKLCGRGSGTVLITHTVFSWQGASSALTFFVRSKLLITAHIPVLVARATIAMMRVSGLIHDFAVAKVCISVAPVDGTQHAAWLHSHSSSTDPQSSSSLWNLLLSDQAAVAEPRYGGDSYEEIATATEVPCVACQFCS